MSVYPELSVWLLTVAVTVFVAVLLLRRKDTAARWFARYLFAQATWTVLYALEVSVDSLRAKLVLDALQNIPAASAALLLVLFAASYAQIRVPRVVAGVLGVAIAGPALVLTAAPWLGSMRDGARIVHDGVLPALVYPFTTMDLVLSVTGLVLAFLSLAVLTRRLLEEPPSQVMPTLTVTAAVALTPVGILLAMGLGIEVFGQRDISFVLFGVGAVLAAVGMAAGARFGMIPLARDRLQFIFDHSFQLVGILDPHGTVLAANRAALLAGDTTEAAVVGRPFWEGPWWAHSEPARKRLREAIERAASGRPDRFETTHTLPSGQVAVIDFSLRPVRTDDGRVVALIPEGRDITELRESELERAELARQLAHAQRLDSLGRLAGGIAHDFKNVLQVVLLGQEIARDAASRLPESPARTDVLESLQDMGQAADDAQGLVRQLLAFSRRDAGAPEPTDVAERLERMERNVLRLLGHRVQLRVHCEPGLPPVVVDPSQLDQIVVNLAVNARDAMPDGGVLDLRLSACAERSSEASPWVCLEVRDTGIGMDQATQEQVFEPFFSTKGPERGTGLGLSVVHGIVERLGGEITVTSAVGEGTCFRLRLPCSGDLFQAPSLDPDATLDPQQIAGATPPRPC